jgi:3-hydroxyisobutyrate dehydrogenase-like beta-hydroxyacid dehydrogenase
MANVAFIGLGVMGFPMAGHLHQKGLATRVFNRSPQRAADWAAAYGGTTAPTPRLAAHHADVVCLCVGNDDDVRSVVYGDDGVLAGMAPGSLLIDHTTASQQLALEINTACKERAIGFLDAPVSGGEAGAQNGQLTVMVGGQAADYHRAEAVLDCYAKKHRLMGPAGSGQLTKMVNQICIAGLVQALAEGVNFAQKAGLDTEAVFDVLGGGAAQSWQMDNRHRTMAEGQFEFGFAVDWMRKDLGIALGAASSLNVPLPVTALVDQFYAEVQALGGNRWDTSSLIARFQRHIGDSAS